MKKRILSVLLSLTLILSSGFPVAGAAAAGSISPDHAPIQDTDGQEEPAAPSAPVPANDPSGETAYYYVYTPDGDWVYIGRGALNNVGPAADAERSSKKPVVPGMVDAPKPDTEETHGESLKYTTYPNITYNDKTYTYQDSSAAGGASDTYTIEWFTYSSIKGYDIPGKNYSDSNTVCWHVDGMLRFSDTPAVTFQVKQPGAEDFEYVKAGDLPLTRYVGAGSSFSQLEKPYMPAEETKDENTYVFSRWYYLDEDDEKIWMEDTTQITGDMELYGEYVLDHEREYGTLTFDMYYLVASQYPNPLDKDSPPGNYGPLGNNVPMISLKINVDALIKYLCETYPGEDVVGAYSTSNGQNYWSITPTSCGLPAPDDEDWSQECYDNWWGDILNFLEDQGSNFEDQLEQIGMGRDSYTGYVLKEQSSRSSFHIDGILRVQPVAYITEYYIDGDFKYLDAAHAGEGDADADYKSTYGEIRAQYEKLIAKDLGVSEDAISFDWANSTFQVGDEHYVMRQESIAHDTGNGSTLMQTKNDLDFAHYTPSTDNQVYRAAFNLSYTSVTDAGLSIEKELIKVERDGTSLELTGYLADVGDELTYQLTVTGHGVDSVAVEDTLYSQIPSISIGGSGEADSGWIIQDNGNSFTATYTYKYTVDEEDFSGENSSLHNVAKATAEIPNNGGTITDQDEYDVPLADRTIRVTPADITIYVGGEGYEAVVDDEGTISENSMPRPLFHVALPAGLSADDVVIKGTGTDGAERTWKLLFAGKTAESADLYYIEAPKVQTPVRVQFTDGSSVTVSDDFNPLEEKSLHTKYTIELFTNGVTNITAESESNGTWYAVDAVGSGTLTIRAVDDDQDPVVPAVSKLETPVADGSGAVVASVDTTYTLNDTTVPAEDGGSGVGLLFDGIIDDADHDRTGALLEQLRKNHGVTTEDGNYQAQYLDLVDSHNGNAWVTASKSVDVYWGYPEGTDQDTEFTLYHFKGLHREGANDGFDLEDVGTSEIETVKLVNTEHGIQFSIDKGGFSPFVLVWSDNSGGTDIPDPGPDPDPDTPPDGPDEPDEPDVPDTPDEPDVPDTPDEPDVPDTPDEPDEPDTPDEPDVPDTPDEPDVPDPPDEPDEPDTPDEPDVPDTPDEPDVPDTPDEPDVPDTPDEPDIPDTPDEPDVPDTPDTPDDPGQPDDTPKTGDTANPILWMTLLLVSGAGIAAALLILNTRLYRGKHLK